MERLKSYIAWLEEGHAIDVDECLSYLHDALMTEQAYRAYEDTGLTPERCAELAQADKEGRLHIAPCKTGEIAYYAHQDVDTTFKYGTCTFIAVGADDYVIEVRERAGLYGTDYANRIRRWKYVFATEQEVAEYCAKRNAEREFIPTATMVRAALEAAGKE